VHRQHWNVAEVERTWTLFSEAAAFLTEAAGGNWDVLTERKIEEIYVEFKDLQLVSDRKWNELTLGPSTDEPFDELAAFDELAVTSDDSNFAGGVAASDSCTLSSVLLSSARFSIASSTPLCPGRRFPSSRGASSAFSSFTSPSFFALSSSFFRSSSSILDLPFSKLDILLLCLSFAFCRFLSRRYSSSCMHFLQCPPATPVIG